MSIFGTIMSKIFHHDAAAATPTPGGSTASPQPSAGAAMDNAGRPSTPVTSTSVGGAPTQVAQNDNPTSTGASASTTGATQTVDVAQVLDGLAAKNSQKLDWKHSIVDMMKLLDLDSSLTARQELAKELNYTGDMHDSASMNIWLHQQVMQKLAANGGKVPDDLKA
ncbi:DUF3597 domain-containing protein [Lichenihabitans psoromatis]|uniref:DUF3597 domain-containing protein n=1 Tax=Lichenihabitans psoromatis TaxID=2528642 RepID=UPI00103849F7|nr:DUF3597 domain-containing protein [Lichenihabitans psoromatis]